ncbi:MAG: Kelch repeat-containing protein [Candidatus Acidiferrales bacterium]
MVLIAGGATGGTVLSSAELYNPSTGTFSLTGSMTVARIAPTATLLSNGMVLIAGGMDGNGGGDYLSSAELYNPSTGTFAATGSMTEARTGDTATLLSNGTVLIAGGENSTNYNGDYLSSAEIYNPATSTFAATGSMTVGRDGQVAVLLGDGTVLIAGGPGSSAELYNPATGTFAATGSMEEGLSAASGTALGNGMVLIAGGLNGSNCVPNAELYNPATGAFAPTGSMPAGRLDATATLLNDGNVLIAGGLGPGFYCSAVESSAALYNPATGTFAATGSMTAARFGDSATLLNSGMVLVAGGGVGLSSAELYDPAGQTGYVDPKFVVVGVTYAPPGPSSSTFVSYGDSTTIGTTNSLSNSFMAGDTYSTSVTRGFNIPMVFHGSITSTYSSTSSQNATNSSSDTVSFETSTAEKTFGTGSYWAPVNDDYDTIWVWLNPAVIFTVSNGQATWNGYGIDEADQPGMDIVGISLGYLNGDFGSMPPDLQTSLNRSWAANQLPSGQNPAITSADYPQIASADPFSVSSYGPDQIGSDPPSPETPDHRFTMSSCTQQQSFDYLQAAPSQNPPIYSCTLAYTNTSTQAKGISSTSSRAFSYDSSFGGGWFATFSLDLKNSTTLTWTTQEQSSVAASTTSTASLSVQGPPCNNQVYGQGPCIPVYDSSGTEPTQFYVYQDNMWGTFMFAPVAYY